MFRRSLNRKIIKLLRNHNYLTLKEIIRVALSIESSLSELENLSLDEAIANLMRSLKPLNKPEVKIEIVVIEDP